MYFLVYTFVTHEKLLLNDKCFVDIKLNLIVKHILVLACYIYIYTYTVYSSKYGNILNQTFLVLLLLNILPYRST